MTPSHSTALHSECLKPTLSSRGLPSGDVTICLTWPSDCKDHGRFSGLLSNTHSALEGERLNSVFETHQVSREEEMQALDTGENEEASRVLVACWDHGVVMATKDKTGTQLSGATLSWL